MTELKSIVDFGDYFKEKYFDDYMVRYFQYHVREPSKILYMLNNEHQDEKVEEVYSLSKTIWQHIVELNNRSNKRRALRVSHYKFLFESIDQQLLLMNRIAERETNWILYPLFVLARELVKVTSHMTKVLKMNSSYIERCGRSVHRSFTLCLNDRNPIKKENRRSGVYMFINLEFKIYHWLENRDMVKNLVKVVKSRQEDRFEPLMSCEKSLCSKYNAQEVTYNYYMGQYYGCIENDYETAFIYLNRALFGCDTQYLTQMNQILILLVPFGLLSRRIFVGDPLMLQIYDKYMNLNKISNEGYGTHQWMCNKYYHSIIKCYQTGNLTKFDNILSNREFEIFFLKNGVYVAMQLLRERILLRLVELVYQINGNASILPFELILIGMKIQSNSENESISESINELECELACLISKGLIKGYLSHGNKCMVVSKTNPFPKLSSK
ncbi:similar to Saccharomyces cerevisiae YJR084W CSN12 Protein that forms a complex with Thp3p [Maudiozyma saulgeensis]|uniref:Similar to Saccharomyces cerevisiae YJR084W CSN12 Protein that forms a complex with Thp3p n=1 Tax=Maudiozyma saulgeensis TaxID=1789683 RepID=A0A1X7R1I7_9SACH|nr:similar to Saccharomyces cerevisiae YJR084W CSN12 Protein that forms a complex with Thp3p [Kazachstania saulgeensis]